MSTPDPRHGDGSISIGPLTIRPDTLSVVLDGRELQLTAKEFRLLAIFAANPGRVLRRERLESEVWDGHAPGRTIDVHVARLRAKLPSNAIDTVVRVGYRFVLS